MQVAVFVGLVATVILAGTHPVLSADQQKSLSTLDRLRAEQRSVTTNMSPVKDSAEEPVWWAIENLPRRCTSKGGTPSKLIETAQTAQQPYETQDKTDAATGQVVQTTVSFPNQGASITFYRGRAGCEDFLNTENNTRKADVDRYK